MPIKLDLYDYQRFHKSIPHRSYYPVISNVQISAGGLVTWTTDVPSTSQVFYGLVPYLGFNTPYDSTYVTSHSVQLSNLMVGVTYYLRVQSFNIDSLSISDLYTFSVGTTTYTALILISPSLLRWSVVVLPSGNLDTEPTPSGPSGAYEPGSVVLRDTSLSTFWTVTIDDTGHLITASGGNPVGALDTIALLDSNLRTWILTVSTSGDLTTS